MTHTAPMHESQGTFTALSEPYERPCGKCGKWTTHRARRWDSNDGGYEDYEYTCLACGQVHWVDGIDS